MALERPQTDRSPLLRRILRHRLIVIATSVLVILSLFVGGVAYALLGQDSTTVTIIPISRTVSNTFPILAVTGTPDASRQEVGARQISTTVPGQKKTVNASGHLSLQATQAHGMLVIHNWDTVPKTFGAGTVLPFWNADAAVTCGNGVDAMIIDAPVTVPAVGASPAEYGTAYVPAHVQEPGSIGNIPDSPGPKGCWYFLWAKGARGSCPNGWFGRACVTVTVATNFTGGQDAYDGPVVQQSDIDTAAHALASASQSNPQQVLQQQMKPGEQLIGIPQCTPQVDSGARAGDHVPQVTVRVSFTCTGEGYDQSTAFARAARMLTTEAATDPGAGYALVGTVKTALVSALFRAQGTVLLTIEARGVWVYHFTEAAKQHLTQLLAGKSKQEALQLASNQPGVAYVTIHPPAGEHRLPADPIHMAVVVEIVPGA